MILKINSFWTDKLQIALFCSVPSSLFVVGGIHIIQEDDDKEPKRLLL